MTRSAAAMDRSGRDPKSLTVVAVSKGRTVDEIRSLYDMGHRDFGENRAQEMAGKVPRLPEDIRWHFVGVLQTNKARLVRPVAHLLHSLDRESLALAWLKGRELPPPVLLQVNVGGESQKSGVDPKDAEAMVGVLLDLGLEVRGLMTIPPVPKNPESNRSHFRDLADLGALLSRRWPLVAELSMGMSDDFEVAIEQGSTLIRVGRAIFGETNDTGVR